MVFLTAQTASPSPEEEAFSFDSAQGGGSPDAGFSGGASVGVVIRMVLVLALAAAAVYGVVFFLRRAGRPRQQSNPHLKILSAVHLGSNRFAYVLSVGTQAWLVGVGEGGVGLISEISDREAVDAMLLDESRNTAEAAGRLPDFRALLRRLGGAGPGGQEGNGFSPENLRRRRERLKGL